MCPRLSRLPLALLNEISRLVLCQAIRSAWEPRNRPTAVWKEVTTREQAFDFFSKALAHPLQRG